VTIDDSDSRPMLRYKLRTLMILLAVGPPMVAGLYFYPTVFGSIGGLIAFSCLGAAIGGIFGMAREAGILAFAFILLFALFLPADMGSRSSPTMRTRIAVRHFNEAINSYRDTVGQLPADLESLLKPPRDLPNSTNWGGPYLSYEALPVDSWGSKFEYQMVDRPNGVFRVWSKGPDRRSETDDDIVSDR